MQTKLETAIDELRVRRQWVAWEYRKKPNRKKPEKVPINPHTWMDASTTDANTWGTYEEAVAASLDGRVGFVFTSGDQYCGVDLDDCVDLDTGEVAVSAVEIVGLLDSYTEVSPSGTGLKVWIKGSKIGSRCRDGNVEIYDSGRFFTFTGKQYGDCKGIESRQNQLEELYSRLFGESKEELHGGFRDGNGFSGDDQQLLLKMRNSGDYKLFRRLYDDGLWHGSKSQSEADMRLLGMLAFWTGRDPERMERLFMGSGLARNLDRKSNQDDYLHRSITRAVKECNNTYDSDYGKKVRPKVRELLEPCIQFALGDSWTGRSGSTDRDIYRALINTGFEYGKVNKDGDVEVAASHRDLALAAGIGDKKTAAKSLKRLEDQRGLIVKVKDSGARVAATYVIKVDSKLPHKQPCKYYGVGLSQTLKIRNPSPNIGTIVKRNGQILDFVHSLNRVVMDEEIAKHLKMRKNNLKKRNIPTLLDCGFLEEKGGGYIVPDDVADRLERFLEESGSLEAERLQRERYEREREAYEYHRNGTTAPPKVVPIKPVLIKEEPLMKRNLPEKNEDQIYDHGTLCECWMCEEDSPEYVPVVNEERMNIA